MRRCHAESRSYAGQPAIMWKIFYSGENIKCIAMQEYDQELGKIRSILVGSTKGYTVTEIARKLGINRNSVAKYLDIMVTSGTVEMKLVGSAKLFTLSKRMPLASIINLSSDYILLLDDDANVTYANENMLRFENSTLEEIAGRPVSSLELARKTGSGITRIVGESLAGREVSTDLEFRSGAELFAFRARFVPGILENNKKGLIVILSSIPDAARFIPSGAGSAAVPAPAATPEPGSVPATNGGDLTAERKFREYLELAHDGIWVFDESARTTFLNRRMADMLGYSVEEMLGHPFTSFIDDAEKPLARKMLETQSREKSVYRTQDLGFVKKDGGRISSALTSTPFFDESGAFAGGLAVVTDITAWKKAEDALRQSEAYYRTIIEASPNGIVIFDPAWKIRMANRQTARYLGYADAQMLDGKNIFNFVSPTDIEKCQAYLRNTMEQKEAGSIECKFIRKDSSGFCVDLSVSLLGGKAMENDFFMGVITDITERRIAESRIRKSEVKYRSLVEGLSSIIFTTDPGGKISYISPAIRKILGYSPEELVGKHFYVLVSSDNRHLLGIQLKEAQNGGSAPFDSQVIDKDGNPHWVRIVAQPMKEDNRLIGIIGIIGDINDWKLAENALSQCSLKYKAVVEDQTDLICRFSPGFNITFANPAFCRFFGRSESEVLGKKLVDLIASPGHEPLARAIAQLSREAPVKTIELNFTSPSAIEYSYHVTARAVFNDRGEKTEFQISCRDISEMKSYFERSQNLLQELQLHQVELRKQNEELRKLQKLGEIAEKQYQELYDTAPVGNLTLDPSGRITGINPSGAHMIGKPQDRIAGQAFTEFISEGSREAFSRFMQGVVSGVDRQFCTVTAGDGVRDKKQILLAGKGTVTKAGQPVQCRAVMVEITGCTDSIFSPAGNGSPLFPGRDALAPMPGRAE